MTAPMRASSTAIDLLGPCSQPGAREESGVAQDLAAARARGRFVIAQEEDSANPGQSIERFRPGRVLHTAGPSVDPRRGAEWSSQRRCQSRFRLIGLQPRRATTHTWARWVCRTLEPLAQRRSTTSMSPSRQRCSAHISDHSVGRHPLEPARVAPTT